MVPGENSKLWHLKQDLNWLKGNLKGSRPRELKNKRFPKRIRGREPTGRADAGDKEVTEPFKGIKALWQQVTDAELCSESQEPLSPSVIKEKKRKKKKKKTSSCKKKLGGSQTAANSDFRRCSSSHSTI